MAGFDKHRLATTAAPNLRSLVSDMSLRITSRRKSQPITVLVGAGASVPAGLPTGRQLRDQLVRDFANGNPGMARFLAREVRSIFRDREKAADLDLFDLCSVMSLSEYGRGVIHRTVTTAIQRASHRPLAYELISHLAKHRFIDNVISLNFDTLLDDAFLDEVAERARIIRGATEVPLQRAPDPELSYLVKPFGTLGEGGYALSIDDVQHFGQPPVREFIAKLLVDPRLRDQAPVLVLVGYQAAEEGFRRLVASLKGAKRLYVVDPDEERPSKIQKKLDVKDVRGIGLGADEAFDLILELLNDRSPAWVPPARHRIVSRCPYRVVSSRKRGVPSNDRFALELVLQAVKCRGFMHFESFGRVPRLGEYGGKDSHAEIERLIEGGVIAADPWLIGSHEITPDGRHAPNYALRKRGPDLAKWIVRRFNLKNSSKRPARSWKIEGDDVEYIDLPMAEYVEEQLARIEHAPDIEVSPGAAREARWLLGPDVDELDSASKVVQRTEEALEGLIAGRGARIRGIWSTGEWLLHPEGWAHKLIRTALLEKRLKIEAVVTDSGGRGTTRSERSHEVIEHALRFKGAIDLRFVEWWELNRVLTLFEPGDKKLVGSAIYFRRRLNEPVVQPYWIKRAKANDAARYLDQLWHWYWHRARRTRIGPRHPMTMARFYSNRSRAGAGKHRGARFALQAPHA